MNKPTENPVAKTANLKAVPKPTVKQNPSSPTMKVELVKKINEILTKSTTSLNPEDTQSMENMEKGGKHMKNIEKRWKTMKKKIA